MKLMQIAFLIKQHKSKVWGNLQIFIAQCLNLLQEKLSKLKEHLA